MRQPADRSWRNSLLVTAAAVGAGLWLWLGPAQWEIIPYLTFGLLPFLVGLLVTRLAPLFGLLPFAVPYLVERNVDPMAFLVGLGASLVATGIGILVRRFIGGMFK